MIEIIDGNCLAEWQLHVRVWVNAARQHESISRIDNTDTARYNEIRTRSHILDDAVFNVNVSGKCAIVIDHLAALDVQTILSALRIE